MYAHSSANRTAVPHTRRTKRGAASVCFLLCFSMLMLLCPLSASALAEAAPEEAAVGAVYLCNIENNLVLYEKNAHALIYPTSSVKIMTGLLACRALAERQTETVTVTAAMLAGAEGRNMGLVVGEELTVGDLLMAVVCGSYNDAACVIAYLSAGSVTAFVEQMNTEAQRLGAQDTVYTNPTGLHDPAMVTTVSDTALVAREAMTNELFMMLVSTHAYTIPATNASDARTVTNRNALVSDTGGQYYNGWCRGMNAGMTDEGGWCVITVWEKGGATNLSIVMQGADVAVGETIPAYTYTNRLLAWAGRNYTYRTVLSAGQALETLPVTMTGTSKSETALTVATDLSVYLPSDVNAETDLTVEWHLTDGGSELKAPLTAGQEVGTVTVRYEGEAVATAPLVVTEDFARNGFLNLMDSFKSYLCSRAFIAAAVCFLILLAVYIKQTVGPGRRYTSKDVYRPRRRRQIRRLWRQRRRRIR